MVSATLVNFFNQQIKYILCSVSMKTERGHATDYLCDDGPDKANNSAWIWLICVISHTKLAISIVTPGV